MRGQQRFDALEEARRIFTICNACRYCEGFCPVFPAMERRREFTDQDILFLANLCHDCRQCYAACPYIPPHEFNLNLPKVMSMARRLTYEQSSRPKWTYPFRHSATFTAITTSISLFLALLIVALMGRWDTLYSRIYSPYQVFPYPLIVGVGLTLGVYALALILLSGLSLWRTMGLGFSELLNLRAHAKALNEALGHIWFRGGGAGCAYPRLEGNLSRMLFHASIFYGFTLDFLSTILASVYQDILKISPPFPLLSAPVVLGMIGGIMLCLGTVGLIVLKAVSLRDTETRDLEDRAMVEADLSLLTLLLAISLTGLITLALRSTNYDGLVLTIHLALVASLFLTAPYSKLTHLIHRYLALVRDAIEEIEESTRYMKITRIPLRSSH